VNLEQWEWALKQIQKKNRRKAGSGYIQTFNTGAANVSVEISLKRDAEKAIMQCIKQFGLDPKSEKELKQSVDPSQGDLFEGFKKLKES
jgi:phage terminase small subunit